MFGFYTTLILIKVILFLFTCFSEDSTSVDCLTGLVLYCFSILPDEKKYSCWLFALFSCSLNLSTQFSCLCKDFFFFFSIHPCFLEMLSKSRWSVLFIKASQMMQIVSLAYASMYNICRLKMGVKDKLCFRPLLACLQFNLPGKISHIIPISEWKHVTLLTLMLQLISPAFRNPFPLRVGNKLSQEQSLESKEFFVCQKAQHTEHNG